MSLADRDLAALFANGVAITFPDGTEAECEFYQEQDLGEDETGLDVLIDAPSVLLPFVDVPSTLAINDVLVINGRTFALRDRRREEDGRTIRLYLVEP